MTAQQKMVLIVFSLSLLEVMFTCIGLPCVVGFALNDMHCGGCLACHSIVSFWCWNVLFLSSDSKSWPSSEVDIVDVHDPHWYR